VQVEIKHISTRS